LAAEHAKSAHYTQLCRSTEWSFRPFAMETTGGLGPGASMTLKQLSTATETATHIGEIFSLALAKGRAEMLLAAKPLD
jgi:hypothetical protein